VKCCTKGRKWRKDVEKGEVKARNGGGELIVHDLSMIKFVFI
jgi:hypothetical protein